MTIQIISCPSCESFLLEDTGSCPECGYVLNSELLQISKPRTLPTDAAVDEDVMACPNCGETCRSGLVRCWNCSAFLRPEIEASYQRLRENSPIGVMETFELEVIEATSVSPNSMKRRRRATPESFLSQAPVGREEDSGFDEFELSDELQMTEADDDAFELGESVFLQTEGDSSYESSEYDPTSTLQHAAGDSYSDFETTQALEGLPLADASVSQPSLEATTTKSAATSVSPAESTSAGTPSGNPTGVVKDVTEEELLNIASAEEAEIAKIRKAAVSKNTFVVYCPQGHRIRVRDKFRGKTGKCPKCQAVFIVPMPAKPDPDKSTDLNITTMNGETSSSRFPTWLTDVRLHTVVPEKLKLKADSLLSDFQAVDVGISADEILIATLVAGGGMFGGNAKKKPAVRQAMLDHLAKSDAAVDAIQVAAKRKISKDSFGSFVVVQPSPVDTETMFGGIPVFGQGRIAVRIPKLPDDKHSQYLSFSLSEFRTFANAMKSICGIEGLGEKTEIPLTDTYETYKCHINETPVRDLMSVNYYKQDSSFKIEICGWKCSTCGIVVSEEGRAKEKLGGPKGKSLAKAKCPKCKQKFGSNALVHLVVTEPPKSTEETPSESETVAEPAAV